MIAADRSHFLGGTVICRCCTCFEPITLKLRWSRLAIAEELPIDKDALKRRTRTLKECGITRSLPSGYQLSARGHACLAATDAPSPKQRERVSA
ncbi:hypothetical protein [Rhodococcus sp. KRD162]|uniref:hypothetical protein n=1 Tax=Rhodococcus sp. KRD162 TaxID=2729725 RepID=UPI0019D1E445|nr:hypothetical protein [Rhodococcus sp. KRD162]